MVSICVVYEREREREGGRDGGGRDVDNYSKLFVTPPELTMSQVDAISLSANFK